jgi:hypothetical protein
LKEKIVRRGIICRQEVTLQERRLNRKEGKRMYKLNEVNLYENPGSIYYPDGSTDPELDWEIVFKFKT